MVTSFFNSCSGDSMNRYKVLVVTIAKSRYTMALTTPH